MVLKSIVLTAILLLTASLIYPGSQPGTVRPLQLFRNSTDRQTDSLYLAFNDTTINRTAFMLSIAGYNALIKKGMVARKNLLTLIDYSRPSNTERFYVMDLSAKRIVFKTLVAHGRNSGELYARRFSNKLQSHQSALGFYITGDTYSGSQGYSMIISGVDSGYNDNARKRAIVIHGAEYVTRKYAEQYGRLGRSYGCPALPPDLNNIVIDRIKNGSVVFGYYPDRAYINGSMILGYKPESNSHKGS
jgi:hypothetical protein